MTDYERHLPLLQHRDHDKGAAATKSAWTSYRAALRNVPQQNGFPDTVIWPTQP